MADRGRRARPMSSRLCAERDDKTAYRLHLERLQSIKSRLDNKTPQSMNFEHMKPGNNHKKNYNDTQRGKEILRENDILLNKMTSITRQQRVLKPWSARSSLNFKAGFYYDSGTSQAFVDNHLSLPRGHPRGGKSEFSKMEDAKALLRQNQKILNAIETRKPFISSMEHAKHASLNDSRIDMLSTYRGPKSARYMPERSSSPSCTMRASSARMSSTYNARGTRSTSTFRKSAYNTSLARDLQSSPGAFRKEAISTAPSAPGTQARFRPQTAPNRARKIVEKDIDSGDLLGALPPPNTQFSASRGNSLHASAFHEALDSLDEGAEALAEPEAKAVPKSEEPELQTVESPKKEPSETGPATPAQATPGPAPSSSDNWDQDGDQQPPAATSFQEEGADIEPSATADDAAPAADDEDKTDA